MRVYLEVCGTETWNFHCVIVMEVYLTSQGSTLRAALLPLAGKKIKNGRSAGKNQSVPALHGR